MGDPIELQSLNEIHRNRKSPISISSSKTNIGHCEMSAGIGGLIRLILNMENDMITKHLNMKELNPYIGVELMESMNSVISIEER